MHSSYPGQKPRVNRSKGIGGSPIGSPVGGKPSWQSSPSARSVAATIAYSPPALSDDSMSPTPVKQVSGGEAVPHPGKQEPTGSAGSGGHGAPYQRSHQYGKARVDHRRDRAAPISGVRLPTLSEHGGSEDVPQFASEEIFQLRSELYRASQELASAQFDLTRISTVLQRQLSSGGRYPTPALLLIL